MPMILFLVALGLFAMFRPDFMGDTFALVAGAGEIKRCIAHSIFSGCKGAGYFPTLQYIPAVLLKYLSASDNLVLKILVLINFLSFLGILKIFRSELKSNRPLLYLAWIALFTSPLIFYSKSSFGELLAAFLLLFYVSSCIHEKRTWVVVAASFFAGLTKETAAPFLIFLAVGIFISSRKRRLWPVLLGIGLSYLSSGLFNLFRFGTWTNTFYMNPVFRVHSVHVYLNYVAGLLLSPNGGIFFFWPLFIFIMGAVIYMKRRMEIASIFSILVFGGLILSFSAWFSPFGWVAWGPRLLLPWAPALLLIIFHFEGASLSTLLAAIARRDKTYWALAALTLVISIPHALMLLDTSPIGRLFIPSAGCPAMPNILVDSEYFYRCGGTSIWPSHPVWVDLYERIFEARSLAVLGCYGGLLFWFGSKVREGLTNYFFPLVEKKR